MIIPVRGGDVPIQGDRIPVQGDRKGRPYDCGVLPFDGRYRHINR
jgi:hypothetical protein